MTTKVMKLKFLNVVTENEVPMKLS